MAVKCLTWWTGCILDIYISNYGKPKHPPETSSPYKEFLFLCEHKWNSNKLICIWYSSDLYLRCSDGSTSKPKFSYSNLSSMNKTVMSSCLCRACPCPAWWAQSAGWPPALHTTSDCVPLPAEPADQSCKQMTSFFKIRFVHDGSLFIRHLIAPHYQQNPQISPANKWQIFLIIMFCKVPVPFPFPFLPTSFCM